ncbi:MAG: hypothetical protein ACPGCV_06615 [Bacteroidia bacterium]
MSYRKNWIPDKTPLKLIWDIVLLEKRNIHYLYVYAVISGAISLAIPLGIQTIVGYVMAGQLNGSWLFLSLLITGTVLLAGLTRLAQISIIDSIQRKLFLYFGKIFKDRIRVLKEKGKKMTEQLEMQTSYFYDVVTLQKSLSKLLTDFTGKLLQALFGVLLLAIYHPLFIAFGIALLFVVYTVLRLTWKRGFETARWESNYKFRTAQNLKKIFASDKSDIESDSFDENINQYAEGRNNHFKILYQQAWLGVVTKVVFTAFLLLIGSYLLVEQRISLGQFLASEILIIILLDSIEKLILTVENLYDCGISLEKLNVIQLDDDQ